MSDHDQFDQHDFETRLAWEMKCIPAPDGFADRVMSRIAVNATQQRKSRLLMMPRRSAWVGIAAMLLIGALIGGWQWRQQHVRRERQQAEQIQRQFDLAMQVTQRTLAEVQVRIGHAGKLQKEKQ